MIPKKKINIKITAPLITPLYVKFYYNGDYQFVINLLLLEKEDNDEIIDNSHYVLIKNLNAFLNLCC